MILVLLGTNPYPFDRLLAEMSQYAQRTGEKVIAQSGNTSVHEHIDCRPFMNHGELLTLINAADVVVCQGGYGSLSDCISQEARIVAVPRRNDLGECVDDQKELVQAFAQEGLVTPVYDVKDLLDAIENARGMSVKKLDTSALPMHISNTIQSMLAGGVR
ncbi:MAG: glycosyltransferase [Gammaproteobacteria bacterium]|nr:glycosyltransferase [Gammaproteobacteria bacterium]